MVEPDNKWGLGWGSYGNKEARLLVVVELLRSETFTSIGWLGKLVVCMHIYFKV